MGASNFLVQDDFPLWAFVGSELDEIERDYIAEDAQADLDEAGRDLAFFTLEVRSGYYCGLQFYAKLTEAAENAGFDCLNDSQYAPDNDSCHYWLGCCRSRAMRKYSAEIRKVNRIFEKIGESYGFEKFYCAGRFSNGEAVYYRAG